MNLEEKSTATTLDERLKDVDSLIELVNKSEDYTLAGLDLPSRDDYIFSLYMLREKQVVMQIMQDEFEKVVKDI